MDNIVSDLSSELAIAILIDKRHTEKLASKEARELIGNLRDALHRVSAEHQRTAPADRIDLRVAVN